MAIEVGNTTKGTVVKILDFGAIVRLEGGSTGLIHISEIADAYVRDVREYVQENDEVTVKVLRPGKQGRYDLSLKQSKINPSASDYNQKPKTFVSNAHEAEAISTAHSNTAHGHQSFEDRLSKFLKDSEERQHELRRHIDSKRGRK